MNLRALAIAKARRMANRTEARRIAAEVYRRDDRVGGAPVSCMVDAASSKKLA